ncbi:MAG: hydroxymethylbilane synthase [Betaproteobacteria bacterium]|nr:hydroxymethylbilane synthase [Betaproteobacteria bacterium]
MRLRTIAIASRASELALWQANHVGDRLRAQHPDCTIEIVAMSTRGDRILDRSLAKIGGKGLFVKELENALSAGRARIAVHSMKDVPMQLPDGFTIGAILAREDARDALVSNAYPDLASLPPGARVGTSSLRREAQLRSRYPALVVRPVRGNVQSRLRKLDEGELDALILAAAGLERLGLAGRIRQLLSVETSLPAPGQGALGIECLAADRDALELIAPLQDPTSACAVTAERVVSRLLGGSCQVPLGAYAECEGTTLELRAFVALPDGSRLVSAQASGSAAEPEALGAEVAAALRAQGADALLAELEARG